MKCIFCHGASGGRRDREHLISRPVAEAFGIDRDITYESVDHEGQVRRSARLATLQVKLPCDRCNSSWMGQLEVGMPSVAKWMRGGSLGLSRSAHETLRRWLVKTVVILGAMDGEIRTFMSADSTAKVMPEATRARSLYEGSDEAFAGVTLAVARRQHPYVNQFGYRFGRPTVVPVGSKYASGASATALVMALGQLQCWVICTLLPGAEVTLPSGPVQLTPGIRFRELAQWDGDLTVQDLLVDNGEHDINSIIEQTRRTLAE